MRINSKPHQHFISPTLGKLQLDQLITEISRYLSDDPESQYRLVIGSDSHERRINGKTLTNFVSAIVVHRVGKGGRYFWQNGLKIKTHSIREKIYQETTLSIDLAAKLVPKLNQKLNGKHKWSLEIHIDVGRSGQTRDMIKEVVGMDTGNDFFKFLGNRFPRNGYKFR